MTDDTRRVEVCLKTFHGNYIGLKLPRDSVLDVGVIKFKDRHFRFTRSTLHVALFEECFEYDLTENDLIRNELEGIES